MNDLVIRNCLDFNQNKVDIFIKDGKIEEVSEEIQVTNLSLIHI